MMTDYAMENSESYYREINSNHMNILKCKSWKWESQTLWKNVKGIF